MLFVGWSCLQDSLVSADHIKRRVTQVSAPQTHARCPTGISPRSNAGGRVTADAIRSLTISQQLLGTREIFVVHHTDCGMETFENADLAKILKDAFGVDASGQDFLPFKGVDKSVADDVELLQRSDTILKGTPIIGLVYDVKTGAARPDRCTAGAVAPPPWRSEKKGCGCRPAPSLTVVAAALSGFLRAQLKEVVNTTKN